MSHRNESCHIGMSHVTHQTGYSQMIRGDSFRSDWRVPTHILQQLRCVAAQHVAVCCSVLQHDRFWSDWRVPTHILQQLRCVAVCGGVLQRVAVCCSVIVSGATGAFPLIFCGSSGVLQRVAVCCSVLQCVAV